MTSLFTNGLNAMIETQTAKSARGSEAHNDLEAYADMMEYMSDV